MRVCPKCHEPRAENEFQRVIKTPSGEAVTLPTRDCIRCISDEARDFHKKRHARERSQRRA